jgi:anti-sigma regulatory factor (Ser/Thr protein kinase)
MESLTIAAQLADIDKARAFLRKSVRGLALSEEEFFKLDLALVEMCTNIILYAYPEKKGEIHIEIWLDSDRIYLEIRDSGIPFDPSQAQKPDIEDIIRAGQKGGLGIYLSRTFMDGFDYERRKGQNVLTLVKKVKSI